MPLANLTVFHVYCFSRRSRKDNPFRCTYVLPDGITHTKGYVKDLEEARRYLSLPDGSSTAQCGLKEVTEFQDDTEKPEDRRRIDLTKNVASTTTLAKKIV